MGHNITSERDNFLKCQQAQESFIKLWAYFHFNTQPIGPELCNSLPELG